MTPKGQICPPKLKIFGNFFLSAQLPPLLAPERGARPPRDITFRALGKARNVLAQKFQKIWNPCEKTSKIDS